MPGKNSKFASVTGKRETIERLQKIAQKLEVTPGELLERLTKSEAFLIWFFQKLDKAEVKGPFVRKGRGKLERFFLVNNEEVVTEEWTTENIEDVKISERK